MNQNVVLTSKKVDAVYSTKTLTEYERIPPIGYRSGGEQMRGEVRLCRCGHRLCKRDKYQCASFLYVESVWWEPP